MLSITISFRSLTECCVSHLARSDLIHRSEVQVRATNLNHIRGYTICVALKVLDELGGKALGGCLVEIFIGPALDWAKDVWVNTEALSRHLQVETSHDLEVGHVEGVVMDGVDDGAGLRETHAMTDTVAATDIASVNQPHFCFVLLALFGEHLGVDVGVKGKESFTIAGGESHLWFSDSYFCSCYL